MLNRDYKIFAKGLATKLALTALSIIYKNQTGSVSGTNHSQLCALSFDEFVMEIKKKWLKSDWKDDLIKRMKNDQPSGLDFLD